MKPNASPDRLQDGGACATPQERRLLMVEFVAIGRFIMGIEFPFLFGSLKNRAGFMVQRLRFGLEPAARYRSDESGIPLSAPDLAGLLDRAGDFRPTDILFSHAPAASLWQGLQSHAPGASIGFLSEQGRQVSGEGLKGPRPIQGGAPGVSRWLGIRDWSEEREGLGGSDPDFGFIPCNDAAREMPPLGFIVAGAECLYSRSIPANPAYAGVDLGGCKTMGCAFCFSGGARRMGKGPMAGRALHQIRRFYETHPSLPPGVRVRLRLAGQQVLLEIAEIAAGLRGLKAPPTDLLLDARADFLLKIREALASAAAKLVGSGHALHVCLVGIENFSARELERMNKGVRPWQNMAAVRLLGELERATPETFRFREHGGLSTILFTPWTRLEDLALNLAVARHFRIESVLGKFLTSRLRLYEGLAMTALARRDGLIVTEYGDRALDTARRNFYPDELPWRFRRPEAGLINQVFTRMDSSPTLADDPLYQRVQEWLGGGLAPRERFERAAQLVRRAMEAPVSAVEDLLAPAPAGEKEPPPVRAVSLVPAGQRLSRGRRGRSASGLDREGDGQAPALLAFQRAGIVRLSRVEGLSQPEALRFSEHLAGAGFHREVVKRCLGDDTSWEVFFGRDPAELAEAVSLTGTQYSEDDPAKLVGVKERIGELYGYPACCRRSYAAVLCAAPSVNEWLILKRRCADPGPVPMLLNPFQNIHWVPCSFRCEKSAALGRAVMKARRSLCRGPKRFKPSYSDPTLFLLDRPGQYLTLIPEGDVGRRFKFTGGYRGGSDPRLTAIAPGGIIRIEEGSIVVERGGRTVASFFVEAAVWWAQKALDPEFWTQSALEALEPATAPAALVPEAGADRASGGILRAPAAIPPATQDLAGWLNAILLETRARFAGFQPRSVTPCSGCYVAVGLERSAGPGAPESLVIHVEPAHGAQRYFKTVSGLAVGYSDASPLDSPARRLAFAAFLSFLAARPREPLRREESQCKD